MNDPDKKEAPEELDEELWEEKHPAPPKDGPTGIPTVDQDDRIRTGEEPEDEGAPGS